MTSVATKPIRSPSYPSAPLSEAISQVRKIEAQYRLSPVDRVDAAKLIGYSSLSGPASAALSALAHYGLVERAGKGEMRVTPLAQAILHPNGEGEKRESLRRAAFEPALFRELHERFPNMTPPVEGIITYLNRQGFNQTATKPAARAYLQTLSFLEEAGASESHGAGAAGGAESTSPEGDAGADDAAPVFGGARVGDLIQWESQGELRLPKPTRVRLVTDDGQWVAVEGSETGIPMSEVIVHERATATQMPAPRFALEPEQPQNDKANKPEAGEIEWMRNRLSGATTVRLLASGDMGPREIGKLIKLLEAQRAVLEDDDDEDLIG